MKYYGGFWSRAVALIIDATFLVMVSGGVAMFLNVPLFTLKPDPAHNSKLMLLNLISMVVSGFYYTVFQGIMQGTLGKKAMGLMLVDAKTLNQISIGQSVGRYLMQFISGVCFFLLIPTLI